MTEVQKKITSELYIKEAHATESKYRVAHLIGAAHASMLDCFFDLIDIYNQKFNVQFTSKNFKL